MVLNSLQKCVTKRVIVMVSESKFPFERFSKKSKIGKMNGYGATFLGLVVVILKRGCEFLRDF